MVEYITITVVSLLLVSLLIEWLHFRRVNAVASLVFQRDEKAKNLSKLNFVLRIVCVGVLGWALCILYILEPKVHRTEILEIDEERAQHLIIVLDVSPSMRLQDAGVKGEKSRMRRAYTVINSMLGRLSKEYLKISVIATYTGSKKIVVDTKDVNLIANIMDDLPLHFAFEPGDTDLFSGVEEAASIAEDWRYGSSALVLVSDGETIPSSGMPRLPASIKDIMVIGVGDPKKGTQLNGRQLRQNIPVLRQMAIRLGGDFHNANKMHVPTDLLKSWSSLSVEDQEEDWGLREWALLSFGLCSTTLAGLPMMLALVMNYRKQVKETK